MLYDLVQEKSISYVAEKYDVNRGSLQQLQIAAGSFAAMLTTFCQHLAWWDMQLLIGTFKGECIIRVQILKA